MWLKDCYSAFWDDAVRRSEIKKDPEGYSTGLPKLDRETAGFCGGDYWIVAAESGVGKTTLCFNMAMEICRQDATVAYFVTEMSQRRCIERLLSMQTSLDYYIVRRPYMWTSEQYQNVLKMIEKTKDYKLDLIAGQSFLSDDIISYVSAQEHKPDVVFVDYLQQCIECQGQDFVQGTQQASFNLQNLAKTENVCVVAVSQYSYEGRLKGSSSIKQNADNVLELTRNHKSMDEDVKSTLKISIDKARYGSSGIYFDCFFNLKSGKIIEIKEGL